MHHQISFVKPARLSRLEYTKEAGARGKQLSVIEDGEFRSADSMLASQTYQMVSRTKTSFELDECTAVEIDGNHRAIPW